MRKIKILIFISIFIIIILCVVLIGVLKQEKIETNAEVNEENILPEITDTETKNVMEDFSAEDEEKAKQGLDDLFDRANYYNVQNSFEKYLEYVHMINRPAVLALLSSNYVNENKITEENVGQFIMASNDELLFEILELEKIQNSDVMSYAVKGVVMNKLYEFVNDVYFIMNLDKTKYTFSIEFITEDDLSKIESRNITSIEKNDYNTYISEKLTTEYVCNNYLNKYKKLALAKPDEMYSLLDKDYRESRFETVEGFKKYVDEHREDIAEITLSQYQQKKNSDTTMYICKDEIGKFYIINEQQNPMNFNMMLDAYTIELPQTIEAYTGASIEERMNLDIQTIIMAINDENYKYLYGILEDNFKKNFSSQEDLEKYLKEIFYKYNKADEEFYLREFNTYFQCTIKIMNSKDENESKNVVFKIYEEDNYKYKISISLE